MKDKLSQAQQHFSLLDQIPLGVCVLQADQRVLFWNFCLEEWTKIRRADILGQPITDRFPHLQHPQYAHRLAEIFAGGPPTTFSSQLHHHIITAPLPGDRTRIQQTTVTGVPTLDNEPGAYALISIQDVTDLTFRVQQYRTLRDQALQEAEQRRQAQERAEAANRVKDEFLAIVSHELRTPLNPILGWTKLLRAGNLKPESIDRALATIDRNAELQAQLIDDLLDVSRFLRGKLQLDWDIVDLPAVIEAALETVQLAAEAKSIAIHVDLDPTVSPVIGDPGRLQQVLWNLLANSIKFTPSGGQIQVRLELVSVPPARHPAASCLTPTTDPTASIETLPLQEVQIQEVQTQEVQIQEVQITVSDTGQGIAADFLPHIFESFRQADASTTRKLGGLGLGLAIVRHLVELHGGTITATSPGTGQGATFTLRLPYQNQASTSPANASSLAIAAGMSPTVLRATTAIPQPLTTAAATPTATSSSPQQPEANAEANAEANSANLAALPLQGIRIVVVDDDQDTLDLLVFLLEQVGATVIQTTTAIETINAILQHQPQILVSDLGMPEVDGYELIRQLRRHRDVAAQQVQAIALTAYAAETTRQQVLAAGFQRYIAKPAQPETLVRVIRELVGRAG